MKKLLVHAAIAGLLLTPAVANACLCFTPPFDPDDYDTVFLGRALDTSPAFLPSEAPIFTTRFEVIATWKGSVADTVRVRADLSTSCRRLFEAGSEYLVTANTNGGVEHPFTSSCDHTGLVERSTQRIIRLGVPVFSRAGVELPRLDEQVQEDWLDAIAQETRVGAVFQVAEFGPAGRPLIPRLLALADEAEPELEANLLAAVFQIDAQDSSFVAHARAVFSSKDDRRVHPLMMALRGPLHREARGERQRGSARTLSIGDRSPALAPFIPLPEDMINSRLTELRHMAIECLSLAITFDCEPRRIPTDDRGHVLDGARQATVLRSALLDSVQAVRHHAWLFTSPAAFHVPGWDREAMTRRVVEDLENPRMHAGILQATKRALDCGVDFDRVVDVEALLDAALRTTVEAGDKSSLMLAVDAAISSGVDVQGLMCSWCRRSPDEQPEGLGVRCAQYPTLVDCPERLETNEPSSARPTPSADPTDPAQVWVDVGVGITDYEAQSTDEVVSLSASVAARFGHGVIVARGTVAVPLLEERFDEVALLGGLYLEGHHVWLLAAAGIGRASGSIGGELGEELLLDARRDWGPVVAPALEIRVGTTQVWPLGLNVFANLNDESQMIGAHLSVRFRVR